MQENISVCIYYSGCSSKGIKINSSKDNLLKEYGNPNYVYNKK